jgi:putative ABC transport system permease protein
MTLKMAFRNVFRQKRRSLLTVLAMMCGFALGAISIGWADGTYNEVIDTFTRNQMGHIQVHNTEYVDRPSLYDTVNHPKEVGRVLTNTPEVEAWTRRVLSAGLISIGNASTAARIIGIDPRAENRMTGFSRKIANGTGLGIEPAHRCVLGKGLAAVLNAEVGMKAVLLSQAADGSIANDEYEVSGIIDTGNESDDRTSFYLHIDDAQEVLVLDDRVHEIAVNVTRLSAVRATAASLEERLAAVEENLEVQPWQEFASGFYTAMKVDKKGMWITLFVIMLVVAAGILNTVLMSVLERQREYGVLKALGGSPAGIVGLIMLEVNLLAVASIILGTILGLIGNYLLSVYGIALPEPISYGGMSFSHMHSEINLRSYMIPAITVMVTASVVAVFPGLRAARTDPAAAMRTT